MSDSQKPYMDPENKPFRSGDTVTLTACANAFPEPRKAIHGLIVTDCHFSWNRAQEPDRPGHWRVLAYDPDTKTRVDTAAHFLILEKEEAHADR